MAALHAEGAWMDKLALESSVAFESEYVDDGILAAHHITLASLEGSYKLWKGELEFGVASLAGASNTYNEEKFFLGYEWELADKWELEMGVGYTWYPNQTTNPTIDRTYEVYAELEYEDAWGLNPAVGFTYDLAVEQYLLMGGLSHEWDLESCGMKGFALEGEAFAAALGAEDADSDQVTGKTKNGYSFGGVTFDLVYAFNDFASASVGVRYTANNDNGQSGTLSDSENIFGWGLAFTAGF